MVGIYANLKKELTKKYLDELEAEFLRAKIDFFILENPSDYSRRADIMIVLGGDGTILNVVDYLAETQTPMLAINTGTIGFLSGFEVGRFSEVVELIKTRSFVCEEKELLKIRYKDNEMLALNEGLVERFTSATYSSALVKFDMKINDNFVDCYEADGMIISTPTGSTAYSLSAGGAILSPNLSALIATPICAHSLRSKPIVFPFSSVATLTIKKCFCECALVVDGKFISKLNEGDEISFTKSDKTLKYIGDNVNFYGKLFSKLNKWSRN